ncbi:MAG: PAS domain-containing sensor histidine kinase [Acidobacteriales bacterium]|nr:PAS domain-containing sensor histidine kinase [Terriglobales bacterium]
MATLLQGEVHLAERAEAATRFRRMVEANPFGTVIGDLHGTVKYVNPVFLQALGYSEAEVRAGKLRLDQLTPPEYADADARAAEQLRSLGRCDVYEKAYVAKDGRYIPILIGATRIDSAETDYEVAAFVADLTLLRAAEEALQRANNELEKKVADRTRELETEVLDRKRAEMSLRELTAKLLRTQDEERRHMARELHDHAGQTLVAMAMNLAELQRVCGIRSPEVTDLVADTKKLSDDLSKEIRTLSYLLHPPLLDEVGLASALRWFVSGFSERSAIQVVLCLPDRMERLPGELELVLFRVVQECLTNVHRHSGSPTASISLARTETEVTLEVRDQGKGIPRDRLGNMKAAQAGVGVRGMAERVRQFEGKFQIDSDANGTIVTVKLPITVS